MTGTCDFNLNVIEKPLVKFIELVGDSPKVVKEVSIHTLHTYTHIHTHTHTRTLITTFSFFFFFD